MNVLICGGRNFRDKEAVRDVIMDLMSAGGADRPVIITGGARGADHIAENWARIFRLRSRVFPARWDLHGKAAGPVRNQHMIDEGKPDLVIAFPGGIGTADMMRRARAAGIPVREERVRNTNEEVK